MITIISTLCIKFHYCSIIVIVSRFEVQCNSEDVPDRGNCSEYGLCIVMNTTETTEVECNSCAAGFIGNGILCEGRYPIV